MDRPTDKRIGRPSYRNVRKHQRTLSPEKNGLLIRFELYRTSRFSHFFLGDVCESLGASRAERYLEQNLYPKEIDISGSNETMQNALALTQQTGVERDKSQFFNASIIKSFSWLKNS